jgi:hypothetical protein
VNQLARADRDHLDELLAAGAALRQAGAGEALRDASREERESVETLVEQAQALLRDAGQKVTDKTVAEIRDTLHAVAADDEARELVDAGRLTEPRQAIGLGAFALGDATPRPAGKKAKAQAKEKPEQPKADTRRADAAKKRREAEERKRREAEEKRRRKRIADAKRALIAAKAKLERAESAADAARAEVERRQSDLEEAEAG